LSILDITYIDWHTLIYKLPFFGASGREESLTHAAFACSRVGQKTVLDSISKPSNEGCDW